MSVGFRSSFLIINETKRERERPLSSSVFFLRETTGGRDRRSVEGREREREERELARVLSLYMYIYIFGATKIFRLKFYAPRGRD